MNPGPGRAPAVPDGATGQGLAAKLVAALRPRPGQRLVDLACGAGTFFFPCFEAMRGRGVFLAAEWEEEGLRAFLNRLESYVEHPGYSRVEVLRARPERLPLPDRCVDLALLTRDIPAADLAAGLREWRRLLAPGGTLCLLGGGPAADPGSGARPAATESAACSELAGVGFHWRVLHGGFEGRWCLSARL